MILEQVAVEGIRALESVGPIHIGSPTIVTGRNDSGKSTFLKALEFLLLKSSLRLEDLTGGADGIDAGVEAAVTGKFSVSREEREIVGAAEVWIRRTFSAASGSRLETRASVPELEELRNFEELKLPALKELVAKHELAVEGNKAARETFLAALRPFVASQPTAEVWVPASQALESLLPVYVLFSSTEDSDPESDIRNALKTAYETVVRDRQFASKIAELEQAANLALGDHAEALRQHLLERTDLDEVVLDPKVSLRPGFSEVIVSARRADEDAAFSLRVGGAGRRRQVSLAVWEWTRDLIRQAGDAPGARDVVVAYDEPDTHLDYLRQRELMTLLKEQCSSENVRMVIVTHSLVFVDRIPVRDITLFALEDGRTKVERLAGDDDALVDQFLTSVSDSMGVRNSTLLHERVFVFVEGDTESRVFPILFRLVVGMLPQEIGLAVVPCNGNEGALKLGSVLTSRGRTVHVVVDADTETSPSTRKYLTPAKLREHGFVKGTNLSYVGDSELEDCFDDALWAAAANGAWPRDDGAAWTESHFSALRTGKFSADAHRMVELASSAAPRSKQELLETVVSRLSSLDGIDSRLVELIRDLSNLP